MHGIYAHSRFDDLEPDLDFGNVCKACPSCPLIRPDITVMVDWALKINYLSIYLSVDLLVSFLVLSFNNNTKFKHYSFCVFTLYFFKTSFIAATDLVSFRFMNLYRTLYNCAAFIAAHKTGFYFGLCF